LTQGTRMVLQYAQVFNHLCQYAGYHADTDPANGIISVEA
jgi:hypothetical protein